MLCPKLVDVYQGEVVKIKESGKAKEIVAITIGEEKAQETVRKALAVGDGKKISNIIHDSRLGTYGVAALSLAIVVRILLISSLVETGLWLFVIMGSGLAVGKGFIMINRRFFLVSEFAGSATVSFLGSNIRQIVCLLIWFVPCLFIFSLEQLALGILLSLLVSVWCGFRAKFYLGGITGDVLGATAFLTELAFFLGVLLLA